MPQSKLAVESLPAGIRSQVVDKILERKSSRVISEWLLTQGHKVSHAAVNAYNQKVVKKALVTGTKIQKAQALQASGREQAELTGDFTREALAASPILARITAKFSRLDQGLSDVYAEKNYDLAAKLEAQESKAIELLGKAMLDPGFVASAPAAPATSITNVLILPSSGDDRLARWQAKQAGQVIDGNAEEI